MDCVTSSTHDPIASRLAAAQTEFDGEVVYLIAASRGWAPRPSLERRIKRCVGGGRRANPLD